MSTLPSVASKGEKEKSKFQSLDINTLYRVSLGESSENKRQKTTLFQKHGMQSLGKVPNTRRPPANLPSMKSEHSGSDTAVSLVPANGSGWGKQESTVLTPPTPTVQQQTANNTNASATIAAGTPHLTPHQAAIALPVTAAIQASNKPSVNPVANPDKSWSSVMIGSDANAAHPPPYQSPQFQHEFPSLSSGDGGQLRSAAEGQFAPGLSLRPQTEGSWMQGGSGRAPLDASGRSLAGPVVPLQHSAPVGQPLPPTVSGFLPKFMCRGSGFQPNGHIANAANTTAPPVAPARRDLRGRNVDIEELAHRPIIKEEDLSGMDNLTGDMGWAINDDIDYNQKLEFSDDESRERKYTESAKPSGTNKDNYDKTESQAHAVPEVEHKSWGGRGAPRGRHDDDDFSAQREEIASAVERAKQRKKEEEKKFLEAQKAGSNKKLQELNERISKSKRDKDNDEAGGTINPASVPPQTIAPVPILLPDWEREKDVRGKPAQQQQHHDDAIDAKPKPREVRETSDFKQLTQIEGRPTFGRKESRNHDKEPLAGAQTHSFSKQFQSDLPPRFQKQQQLNAHVSQVFNYDSRWSQPAGSRPIPSARKNRDDERDKDLDDRCRRNDDYRTHRAYDSGRKSVDSRYEEYGKDRDYEFGKGKDEEKSRARDRHEKSDAYDSVAVGRQSTDDWHIEKRIEKYDRPQRPDSRDSRASRESRHSGDSARVSEPREYTSWAEEPLEELKKKEHRMAVPGPITKEKLEADDLRIEKARNLTQLKRGSMPDKKLDKGEKAAIDDEIWSMKKMKDIDEPKVWADAIPSIAEKAAEAMKNREEKRSDAHEDDDDRKEKFDKDEKRAHPAGRLRTDSQGSRGQGWSGNVYRSSWSSNNSKKNASAPGRGQRGAPRGHGKDMTESEGSADDSCAVDNGLAPKFAKKSEKDEKNKEAKGGEKPANDKKPLEKGQYIPRGEPSRHGRGGGAAVNFRGSRSGSKRVDTYGPPAKSPFSNIEEKEKKHDEADEGKSQLKEAIFKADEKSRKKTDAARKLKAKMDGDASDNSDADSRKPKNALRSSAPPSSRRGGSGAMTRPPPSDRSIDKRGFGGPRNEAAYRQNPSSALQFRNPVKDGKKEGILLASAIANSSPKDEEANDAEAIIDDGGFQDDKNKKPERKPAEKSKDDKAKILPKAEKDAKLDRAKSSGQITSQQLASIPSLMATPVNPPPNMPQLQSTKIQSERNRQNKMLPPRFAKAREHNRMHKMQQGISEEMPKVGQSSMYAGAKEGQHVSATLGANAWEKPLPSQLRTVDQELAGIGMEACKSLEVAMHHPGGQDEKAVIDGSKPLNTIIFENTNYKSAPGARARSEKPRCSKMDDGMDMANYKPIGDLLGKEKRAEISMPLFNKEDTADMKLDFLESEITQITEDKASKMSLSRNMAPSNNILNADALNMKIASVKKVWEAHGNDDAFASSFATDANAMDASAAFSKGSEVVDENHDVYATSPNANASNSTTNVCKVKPTQQVAGSAGQSLHQAHSNMPTLIGHNLSSPPPIQPVIGPLGQPQQYTANQHLGYQAGLGSNQYGGLPAPSPPTVLNYTTQQLQQTGLYASFQIDQSQVLNNQGRSQFSQYSFGQTGSSPYSQSMYLQAGQPHAPPNAQPELYQSMNSYRLPNTGPFGQNQQLNNPTTVLISSTSNSLMSPSVKPSNQPISAIGTKAGGVGQAYQQQSQQGQQVYIPYDPSITANYMQNPSVIQRGPPAGPVQSNVVAGLQPTALQPSSSFYSGSTGAQTGYFQGPGSSTLQTQMSQQTGFGVQQSVFPAHNQSHTNAGMQNYASPYFSGHMQQLAAAAAMTQQQYRSANMQNSQYMKNQIGDQGRQQLKSPGSQQSEVMSSVFNSGSQIASPKLRQQMKQPPPQPSPTAQHNKYLYGSISNPQSGQTRYPTPIQRPAGNYQSPMGNVPNNSNQKTHRLNNSTNRSTGGRQYYGPPGGNINTQSDKNEDSKLDNVVNASNPATNANNIVAKGAASATIAGDKNDAKEESCAKD